MKIGIAGPFLTSPFAEYLDQDISKAPRGLGGISVVQLVKGLLKIGHCVSVYSLDEEVDVPVILGGERLSIFYGKYRKRHRMRDFMRLERNAIRDFIIRDSPDIVNAHWTYEYALGALASGKPAVVTVRDWAPTIFRLNVNAYRLARSIMHFYTLSRAKYLTANSPYIANLLKKYTSRAVPVIPNSLEENEFFKGEKILRRQRQIIVSVNNGFGKGKNVTALLEAFRLIRTKIPDARLILLGYDFENQGKAQEWARKRDLCHGVQFCGAVDRSTVLEKLRFADLLIHPSLEESFGLVLAEAMAQKTPVIGGKRSGAVAWVLDNGNAGVLTDVRDPGAIAQEAIKLLSESDRWERFSMAGSDRARECFCSSLVVKDYVRIYHDALQGNQ